MPIRLIILLIRVRSTNILIYSFAQLLDELSAHAQDPQARFLRDFLSSAMPAVMDNGNQLFSQMSLYQPAADRYRALMDAPPFPTLMPLILTDAATAASQLSESTTQLSDGASAAGKFDLVKRFNDDANYVIDPIILSIYASPCCEPAFSEKLDFFFTIVRVVPI